MAITKRELGTGAAAAILAAGATPGMRNPVAAKPMPGEEAGSPLKPYVVRLTACTHKEEEVEDAMAWLREMLSHYRYQRCGECGWTGPRTSPTPAT